MEAIVPYLVISSCIIPGVVAHDLDEPSGYSGVQYGCGSVPQVQYADLVLSISVVGRYPEYRVVLDNCKIREGYKTGVLYPHDARNDVGNTMRLR